MQENISKFENIKNIQQNTNNKEKEREKRDDEEKKLVNRKKLLDLNDKKKLKKISNKILLNDLSEKKRASSVSQKLINPIKSKEAKGKPKDKESLSVERPKTKKESYLKTLLDLLEKKGDVLINNEEKLLKKTFKKANIVEFLENKNIYIASPALKNLINSIKKEGESEKTREKPENKEEGLLTNHLKTKDDDYDIEKAVEKELNLEKLSSFLEKKEKGR